MKFYPKILSVVGARPQFIKLAPLAKALNIRCSHTIIHTGQHYDYNMSDVFFRQLKIPQADINLRIGGGHHGEMTGRMLIALEKVYLKHKPDLILVYGDTNTTLAGALTASKISIPVGHIEAGLRSYVDNMPEEINRRLVDHLAQLLFCPTTVAKKNLHAEGVRDGIVHSGDLMYELLHDSTPLIQKNKKILKKLKLSPGGFLLMTLHRAANVDDKENLRAIIEILNQIDRPVLFPVHPRTRKNFSKFRLARRLEQIKHLKIVEPLSYLDLLTAAYYARAVMTDSGGLQKEAVFLKTPVLTLRDETEWVETLKMGNRIVGLNQAKIINTLKSPPRVKKPDFRIRSRRPSKIIAREIIRFLKEK